MTERLHAAIAGGGIGGLTAAVALARLGFQVTVLERSPTVTEIGAGLQLSPNATSILSELGLLQSVLKRSLAPEALLIRAGRGGGEIVRIPLGPIAEMRWGTPFVVLHRADLHAALAAACSENQNITIDAGANVAGFAVSGKLVEIAVKRDHENQRIEADFLIGADGLRSTVRERIGLGMTDSPIWSGRMAWRALIPASKAPSGALRFETNLWLGSRAHIVHYPLRGGELVNVVAITESGWRGEDAPDLWSIEGSPREVSARFSGWARAARDLIQAATEWRKWPLFDRNPAVRWGIDRVALLGDAAHPMLPFFAQGASQAIEDAGALYNAFARHRSDIAAALNSYQATRISRANAVAIASRRQGAIYHFGGPAALARDLYMRHLGPPRLMERLDWLYGYRAMP